MTSVLYRKFSPKWTVPGDVYLFTEFTPVLRKRRKLRQHRLSLEFKLKLIQINVAHFDNERILYL